MGFPIPERHTPTHTHTHTQTHTQTIDQDQTYNYVVAIHCLRVKFAV